MDKAMRAATGHVEGNARPRLGGAMSRIYVAISNAARDPIGLRDPRRSRSAAACFMPGTVQSRWFYGTAAPASPLRMQTFTGETAS